MYSILLILFIIVFDQFTKKLAIKLKNNPIALIENKLKLVYVENKGAAWGIFQEKKILLLTVTTIILSIMIYVLISNFKSYNKITIISLSCIIGGAIGNFIDRIIRGYVIDFVSYEFYNGYNFPVFNVADVFVVIGCILLIIAVFITEDFEGI